MSYAIKQPDNKTIFQVVLGKPHEDQSRTLSECNLWAVDEAIPEGKRQDFSAGDKGWYVDGDVVRPCLMDIPPPTPEICPFSVPNFKLRLWLNSQGLLSAIEAIIADVKQWPDEKAHKDALILWNLRPDVLRSSQMVNNLGAALGLSTEDIDAAFIQISHIE